MTSFKRKNIFYSVSTVKLNMANSNLQTYIVVILTEEENLRGWKPNTSFLNKGLGRVLPFNHSDYKKNWLY